MAGQDADRVTAMTAQLTGYGGLTASDNQNRADIADRERYATDEKNRLLGSLAFDVGGAGTPCRK